MKLKINLDQSTGDFGAPLRVTRITIHRMHTHTHAMAANATCVVGFEPLLPKSAVQAFLAVAVAVRAEPHERTALVGLC